MPSRIVEVELRMSDLTVAMDREKAVHAYEQVFAGCQRSGLYVYSYVDRKMKENVLVISGEATQVQGLLPEGSNANTN